MRRRLAELDISGKDRNGRVIARVVCNGTDANAAQVRRGMAWVFDGYAKTDSPLYSLQRQRVQLTAASGESTSRAPWEWRRDSAR
jgi:endonuclease YncB( thermonuclease family)